MEMEKKDLTLEQLEQVSGGVGGGTGKWSIGDRFSFQRESTDGRRQSVTYYFGTLTEILEPYPGSDPETKYIVHAELMAYGAGSFYTVVPYDDNFTIIPGGRKASSYDPDLIKQIYDLPNCGKYGYEVLARWVVR